MSDSLRIALDLTCLAEPRPTGVHMVARRQVEALLDRNDGVDYRVLIARGRRSPKDFSALAQRVSRLTVLPYARRLKLHLWRTLNWPPIEWFCGEVDVAHDLFHQLPAGRRARRIVTVHDLSIYQRPDTHLRTTIRTQDALLRHAARNADALVAVSPSCKEDLIDILGVPPDRVFVVPNGVDTAEFDAPLDKDALTRLKTRLGVDDRYFIHIGTIEPRKNTRRLLDAIARLRDRRPDCPKLLVVGKAGWLCGPALGELARLSERGDVVHVGYMTREEAVLLLRGACACLYPSLHEGFGLPVLEAMAARVPVLTSNVSALPWVADGAALLVEPENTDSIEAALDQLLDNPAGAQARVAHGYERANTLTWAKSAETLVDVYRKIADF